MFGFLEDLIKSPEGKLLLGAAAIAATGGAAAPAVLGAEAAGGAAAAGLAGAEAAGAGAGLLGSAAAAEGATAGAGLLGAEAATTAAADPMAAWLATGATDASTMGSALTGAGGGAGAVGQGSTAGLLGNIQQASQYAKPVMEGMQAANTAKSLMTPTPQAPAPQMRPGAPLNLSSIFQANQQSQANDMQEAARRKQELEMYARTMMGGR